MNTLRPLFAWLANAMSDGENPSSSRLIAVTSLLAVYVVPIGVWAGLSVVNGKLEEVPTSVIGMIVAISSPLLSYSHLQKREESKASTQQ